MVNQRELVLEHKVVIVVVDQGDTVKNLQLEITNLKLQIKMTSMKVTGF